MSLTRMLHLSRGLQPGGRFDEWRRPPVRAVFLDVDGTSLGEHEEPTAAFVDACRAVQDRGATLSFATGRPPAGVDVVREHTGSRGADVVHNGALVLDGGTPIGGWPMPADAAARIARWCLDHQVYAEFAVGSDFLVSDRREVARPAFDDIAGGPDGVVADVDLTAAETFKITIYAFEPEHGPAALALGEELGLHVDPSTAPIFPGVNILNLTASGISKGPAWSGRPGGPASPPASCSSSATAGTTCRCSPSPAPRWRWGRRPPRSRRPRTWSPSPSTTTAARWRCTPSSTRSPSWCRRRSEECA